MAEYSIREISEMFSLPASTLRYYEEIGILTNIPRNASGNRIYQDCHINRLRAICCFKNTGMSIAQLQEFFSYERSETENLDNILHLLEDHKKSIIEKMEQLRADYAHVLRKLHYFHAIKDSLDAHEELPNWIDYKNRDFEDDL